MANQKIFEEDYYTSIKQQIRKGDYSCFKDDYFEYDEDKIVLCNYRSPEGLLERMLSYPADDLFNPARELYEAFYNLTGLQAMYDPFWSYLSLVDLYKYTIRLYPNPQDYKSQYALNHFLSCKYTAYNLRGMWWAIKMTVGEGKDYTFSKFFLNEHSQLTQSLSESQLFRCKEVVHGVVNYFIEHPDNCHRDIINESLKYLNMQGSIKQLACLPSSYFKELLIRQVPFFKEQLSK